jgi:hypothetical protein
MICGTFEFTHQLYTDSENTTVGAYSRMTSEDGSRFGDHNRHLIQSILF